MRNVWRIYPLDLPATQINRLFNLGVEVGQLVFIAALFALWRIVALLAARLSAGGRWALHARTATIFVCGSLGAYWFVGRSLAIV